MTATRHTPANDFPRPLGAQQAIVEAIVDGVMADLTAAGRRPLTDALPAPLLTADKLSMLASVGSKQGI